MCFFSFRKLFSDLFLFRRRCMICNVQKYGREGMPLYITQGFNHLGFTLHLPSTPKPTKLDGNDTTILSISLHLVPFCQPMHTTKPLKYTLPYPHPLNEHSSQHCSLHSLQNAPSCFTQSLIARPLCNHSSFL